MTIHILPLIVRAFLFYTNSIQSMVRLFGKFWIAPISRLFRVSVNLLRVISPRQKKRHHASPCVTYVCVLNELSTSTADARRQTAFLFVDFNLQPVLVSTSSCQLSLLSAFLKQSLVTRLNTTWIALASLSSIHHVRLWWFHDWRWRLCISIWLSQET